MAKTAIKGSTGGEKGGGRDYVRVVVSQKNKDTGAYSFREQMVHKDNVNDYIKEHQD